MTARHPHPFGNGYSLVELVVALVIFQIGLLGVAGMVLTAQKTLARAQLIMRGTLEASRVGDSLLAGEGEGRGELDRAWGLISWAPDREGTLRVVALAGNGSDTLSNLLFWAPEDGGRQVSDTVDGMEGGGE